MRTAGRAAAEDKREAADEVPAAPSSAAQTWQSDVTEDVDAVHRRPSCLEQGKHNKTDEKHDFICHTCIKGAQAELTAFRQKICAVLKHQSTRTHTHT